MWTLGLALWMFDRDRAAADRLAARQVRQGADAGRGQHRRAQRRPCLWRDRRDFRAAQAVRHRAGGKRAGAVPHRHRGRGDLARAGRGRAAGRPADVLRRLSDHPGLGDPAPSGPAQGVRDHHLPGRGRDCRDLRGDRRVLCRAAGRHLVVGPGHRAQGRGDGPGDHDRAAAGDRQFAARRAFDRPADQDRAERSLPGDLRPQRRCPAAGDRRALARRCVRLRDRGLPDRDPAT